jgi:hypothetical protein
MKRYLLPVAAAVVPTGSLIAGGGADKARDEINAGMRSIKQRRFTAAELGSAMTG